MDEIYSKLKVVLLKYPALKGRILESMEVARLKCWANMIKTSSLERKIRGIGNIKRYFDILCSENKISMMIFGELADREKWIRESGIIELIFCQNEHH